VLDPTVQLVQPASSIPITAAVAKTEPRRVGRMTPVWHRSYLARRDVEAAGSAPTFS
jgi:hypothetical protein